MNFRIQNDYLTAIIKDTGAELVELVDQDHVQYIWTADATYWSRHTPILFPLVGKVTNNCYTVGDAQYKVGQHGFARDCNFEVSHQTASEITFMLRSDDKTRALFPFDFTLKVTYTLHNQTLAIGYEVINEDTQEMFFKIGAHPGFRCPLFEDETMEDYTLTFDKEEEVTFMPLTPEGYFKRATEKCITTPLALSNPLFAKDALVYGDFTSKSVTLSSKKHNKQVEVGFDGFPFLGIWSPLSPSPFVCIEPWYGHADYEDEASTWTTKTDLNHLMPHETFTCTHTITIK
ncbi:MAG: aldose 1-epimerase family protein [Niameybacter sp.]